MPRPIDPPRIATKEPPRQIIKEDFPSLAVELPIRGGWGYSRDDAVIIDKNDPTVDKNAPFNGVGIEYVFVEKRIYEELIIFQPEDNCYSGIQWKRQLQELKHVEGRSYDVLTVNVTAFPDRDWDELKAEWEAGTAPGSHGFDTVAHDRKRDERMITYMSTYWFDITSFFGSE
jgi:hypothetical protein